MGLERLLIANRGEIAIRVARSAVELGLAAVAIRSEDDAGALHAGRADELEALPGRGAAACLDRKAILAAAPRARCDAIHPGHGFLSENAEFARACAERGIAFDIPIPHLCGIPGNMVGSEAEKAALVRHCCRLYVTGASVTVPMFTVVLRKSYGLGAQAMAAGSFHAPFFAVSWPTGEFGGMGLEGAVKLGYRRELAAIDDPEERMARYEEMVAAMYEQGKALNTATVFEIDDVIDPADTRRWIVEGLRACPPPAPRTAKKRPCIDTW